MNKPETTVTTTRMGQAQPLPKPELEKETQPQAIPEERHYSVGWNRIRGWRKFLTDLKILFLEQLLQLRTIWPFTLLFSFLMPLALVFGLTRFGGGVPDKSGLIYIIAGSTVFSVSVEGIYTTSQRLSAMREAGRFTYYASLPLNKAAFLLALLLARFVLVTLPGTLTPLIAGGLLYGLELQGTLWWIVVIIPLTGFSLASVGMALGTVIRRDELVGLIANALIFLLLLASPVFIPLHLLPAPLQIMSYFLPPTYAAEAFRLCLSGQINEVFFTDILILSLFALAGFLLTNRYLRWRI
jgi:ABC-2 type transport system permease protein